MPLSAIALITVAELEAAIPLPTGADPAGCEEAINRASELIESEVVHRPIKSRAYTNLRLAGPRGCKLSPPQWAATPIVITGAPPPTLTITIDGLAQTIWTKEADGDPEAFDVIVESDDAAGEWGPNRFHRSAGWPRALPSVPRRIVLNYTGGFSTVPERYKLACLEWARELYLLKQQGTQGVETITTPTGTFTRSARAVPPRVEQLIGHDRLVAV